MKIGIIRETKSPVDNRVAFTPKQVKELMVRYPEHRFLVQSSNVRAFTDNEYEEEGIEVKEDMKECDVLFGIKEASLESLLPDKHYVFFGHIAKRQEYNIPLFRDLIEKRITFTDYEYIVDESGQRQVAFGWFAGVAGLYYTLQAWGRKQGIYQLPAPDRSMTVEGMAEKIKSLGPIKARVVITGEGRVSQGAQFLMEQIGAKRIPVETYINATRCPEELEYCVAGIRDLVKFKGGNTDFNREEFLDHPELFESDFAKFAATSDVLLSCHYWQTGEPVYVDMKLLKDPSFKIKVIGDITCDIRGSIWSTVRSSTHAQPFYDFNPWTEKEEPPFSQDGNITVMAVDTCPNALPREASTHFGNMLNNQIHNILSGGGMATILNRGKLTHHFSHLQDYVRTKVLKAERMD